MVDGLVLSSRVRRAESRVESVLDWPCMAGPPGMEIFVVFDGRGLGEAEREVGLDWDVDLGILRSDIRVPEAEGGGFEVEVFAGLG